MSEGLRVTPLLLSALVLASVACGPQSETASAPKAAPATTPQILTVDAIQGMVQRGETPAIVLGEIRRTGTVYDLTTQQRSNLRADGMPASLLSEMALTRDWAIQKEPSLGTSRARWREIDGYWYGGVPLGWPVEWVSRAPAPRLP